jgi:hypothetical protein
MPLSNYERKRIAAVFNSSGSTRTYSRIQRRLQAEGICTSCQTMANTITKYQATGMVEDRKHSGRPKTVTPEMYTFVDEAMAQNDELMTRKLLEMVTA